MAAPTTTRIGHLIGGVHRYDAAEHINVLNPATEEAIGSVPAGTRADVDEAVDTTL